MSQNTRFENNRSVELLAPAGDWDCARAAVENGADAIYFGLEVGFNARARAANFHLDRLDELMAMLHRQGVKGYVTLNTLIFTSELAEIENHIRQLAQSGVDAVLVQDLGLVRLIRQLCPGLDIHASTQMTLTCADAIGMAEELGVRRVVLARELSLPEIREIRQHSQMPLEVFVHGALCVAYSGQCLTSESLGGRSANRGQCAQACRMPYELVCDGSVRDLGDVQYLLSPQDLAAYELIEQLIDAGVCSLKIEGRLKSAEYVANICRHYRSAIDEVLAGKRVTLTHQDRQEMELSFSRGFSPGWLEGCDHKRLVPGLSSSKRGVLAGTVADVHGESVQIDLACSLSVGDGIVFQADRFEGKEIGGRIYEIFQHGTRQTRVEHGLAEVRLQYGIVSTNRISRLQQVWKTDDPQLSKRLRHSFENIDPQKRIDVDVSVSASVGRPLTLIAECSDGFRAELEVAHHPEPARKHSLTDQVLREQLGRLGASVYRLRNLTAVIEGSPMVPLSVLGELRREMIARLDSARTLPRSKLCCTDSVLASLLTDLPKLFSQRNPSGDSANETPCLTVLCRTLAQVRCAIDCGVTQVIADLHDLREYRQAVEMARCAGASIWLATLRIHKPGEGGLFKALTKHNGHGWLARSLAAVRYCREHQIPFVADFSLNVTNPLTAAIVKSWGAARITASYDLNRDQLIEMIRAVPAHWMEVVVHQHMPMFHMEHCVFCSVLSPGKNKSDCGRPCDSHSVKLRDRVGVDHVLHADIGCRNTLYNGVAQSGAEVVRDLIAQGVRQFRIELIGSESADEVKQLIRLYSDLLSGNCRGTDVWRQLKAHNRVGVTRGTLEQARNPLAIL